MVKWCSLVLQLQEADFYLNLPLWSSEVLTPYTGVDNNFTRLCSFPCKQNSLWQGATVCVTLVFSQHCIASLPLNYNQMVNMTKTGRDERHGVPLCLPLRWCLAVSPALHPWSSPAAAASFPETEPSLFWTLLHLDLGKQDSDNLRVKAEL